MTISGQLEILNKNEEDLREEWVKTQQEESKTNNRFTRKIRKSQHKS